ncbi:MAG: hypothetical protein HOL04_01895 [Gammaproteobacteria bacterium]|jgi:hypothetical protein|nr:hypothetical protein [Gammaproteobacteria bacterium]MBT4608036.1 hypothetical protein [Thiotrichales bacterium]MBT3471954.1 hypothetical protein [Gammaproteobacteria bacterium]MBT3966373.1 hypothetical protein [Gammaproteobacteria bacterium]MBT4080382.1 hypothetical protein [Gammaproteobacteria bacterium]
MAPHSKFEQSHTFNQIADARKKADEAIGGVSHECEVGWKAGTTRIFMRTMARSGGYAHKEIGA